MLLLLFGLLYAAERALEHGRYALLGLAALLLFGLAGVWLQLGLSTLAGAVVLLGMALWLRPWRKA